MLPSKALAGVDQGREVGHSDLCQFLAAGAFRAPRTPAFQSSSCVKGGGPMVTQGTCSWRWMRGS